MTERARLIQEIRDGLPRIPPEDATCHYNLRSQDQCLHCQRIKKAHAAVDDLERLLMPRTAVPRQT